MSLMIRSSHGATDFIPEKFKAQFTQEYKSVVTGNVKRGTGQVEYQYPGQLRFEMFDPDPLTFVANLDRNWLYRPPFIKGEEGDLKKNVEKGNSFPKFFDSLKSGLKDNNYYTVRDLGKNVELVFNEKSIQEMSIQKASLNFKNSKKKLFVSLSDITLHYKNGKETKIIFDKLTSVKSFPRGHFFFKIPSK